MADAVAEAGHSPTLLANLRMIKAQIAGFDRQAMFSKPKELSVVLNQAREFVYTTILQLKELFRGEATALKAVLARHIGQLTLIPKHTPQGAVYEVSREMELVPTNKDVVQVVARDGVEPRRQPFQSELN